MTAPATEMSALSPKSEVAAAADADAAPASLPTTALSEDASSETAGAARIAPTEESADITSESISRPFTAKRQVSEAIGPAAEDGMSPSAPALTSTDGSGPAVLMTLLLTTGSRHPYKIDDRYLKKRGVSVEDNDPWNLPVGKMKELILRDWREDWEEKPHSPAAIRLISMGLELQEGELLRDKRFNRQGPNIVHMVIKREIPDDEEMKDTGGKTVPERRGQSSACCGCVIL